MNTVVYKAVRGSVSALGCVLGAAIIVVAVPVPHAAEPATVSYAGDVGALAAAIGTALQEGRATARRSLGLTVAGERTWEASVAQHLRAYAVARAASQ